MPTTRTGTARSAPALPPSAFPKRPFPTLGGPLKSRMGAVVPRLGRPDAEPGDAWPSATRHRRSPHAHGTRGVFFFFAARGQPRRASFHNSGGGRGRGNQGEEAGLAQAPPNVSAGGGRRGLAEPGDLFEPLCLVMAGWGSGALCLLKGAAPSFAERGGGESTWV